ncbi:hypothetical protein LX83_002142 [Goodfellowiella coeruleoviolacea]|uniref:Uncharacterized protein n=1 Tax=Goodfellowiella coeruleoviolacea TaxID=334858 RepID=A0AAE3KKC9_9PSEU|nr:hypothetical protein [Goodfellowiella coeruleoviolacea]
MDTPGLVVVAEAFDAAEADSAVLARSPRWVADQPAVLRHHLLLPASAVDRARDLLAPDGWQLRPAGGPAPEPTAPAPTAPAPAEPEPASPAPAAPDAAGAGGAGLVRVHALRVQRLDALSCAQERSRMAGLAQRLGGDSAGWDAMQPGLAKPDSIG